jgi:hypothetical protein
MAARLALTRRGGVSNLPHPVAGAEKPRRTTIRSAARAGSVFSIFACRVTRKAPGFEPKSLGSLCAPSSQGTNIQASGDIAQLVRAQHS